MKHPSLNSRSFAAAALLLGFATVSSAAEGTLSSDAFITTASPGLNTGTLANLNLGACATTLVPNASIAATTPATSKSTG